MTIHRACFGSVFTNFLQHWVRSVKAFLDSSDQVPVCTHATFRFAVDKFGVEAFDDRLIAVDEFHHVSANPDNKLGLHLGQLSASRKQVLKSA